MSMAAKIASIFGTKTRCGMSGFVLDREVGLVRAHGSERHHAGTECAIHLALEGDGLAPIGVAAGRGRRRVRIGDVLGDDLMRRA